MTGLSPAKTLAVWRITWRDAAQSPQLNAGWPQLVLWKFNFAADVLEHFHGGLGDIIKKCVAQACGHELNFASSGAGSRDGHWSIKVYALVRKKGAEFIKVSRFFIPDFAILWFEDFGLEGTYQDFAAFSHRGNLPTGDHLRHHVAGSRGFHRACDDPEPRGIGCHLIEKRVL